MIWPFLFLFGGCSQIDALFDHPLSDQKSVKKTDTDEQNRTRTKTASLPHICFNPNTTPIDEILQEKGLKPGIPLYIRIFKLEKELELWGKNKERYELLKTYPICKYSGKLGPKLKEGDKQAPEGVYVLTRKSLHPYSRFHLALNIQYPNRYDRNHHRTGNLIMIHGKCSSTGCFAMGNTQIEEIYRMVESAFLHHEKFIYVAIYPFRMKEETLALYKDCYWYPFWLNLKTGYDFFEQTHVPPFVGVKKDMYVFQKRGTDINKTVMTASLETNASKQNRSMNLTQN